MSYTCSFWRTAGRSISNNCGKLLLLKRFDSTARSNEADKNDRVTGGVFRQVSVMMGGIVTLPNRGCPFNSSSSSSSSSSPSSSWSPLPLSKKDFILPPRTVNILVILAGMLVVAIWGEEKCAFARPLYFSHERSGNRDTNGVALSKILKKSRNISHVPREYMFLSWINCNCNSLHTIWASVVGVKRELLCV